MPRTTCRQEPTAGDPGMRLRMAPPIRLPARAYELFVVEPSHKLKAAMQLGNDNAPSPPQEVGRLELEPHPTSSTAYGGIIIVVVVDHNADSDSDRYGRDSSSGTPPSDDLAVGIDLVYARLIVGTLAMVVINDRR